MIGQLNKNINQLLQEKYIIPLYQRNFAWREEEISQFLQDIYETYNKDKNKNYYIGSLVVIQREDGLNEVIDGQQRLTIISLIAKILNNSKLEIKYDSRPEVENFFHVFYNTGDVSSLPLNNKLFHLINAVDYIKNTILNPDASPDKQITIIDIQEEFKEYFFNNVIVIKVNMPIDTDVAEYFEIMNNRGEQLYKHEIIKARLLEKIPNTEKQQLFSEIWDACSQMDTHIQKLFKKEKRKKYFGNEYDSFNQLYEDEEQIQNTNSNTNISTFTIEEILENGDNQENITPDTDIDDVDDIADDKSIIDFPNFLMHIFRLLYNECYKKEKEQDIPLNEKYLIDVFNEIKDCIEPIKFIEKLFFYKVVFDRFVIKATKDDNAENDFKWSLLKPYKYYYEKKRIDSLKYKNSFDTPDTQEHIIKALSMLQVTFRQRIYKNWLQEVLSWFNNDIDLKISAEEYLKNLHEYILHYYKQLNLNIKQEPCYSEGTRTPHFLLNLIDYLYWIQDKNKFNFEFKYRNSIEHHLPQSYIGEEYSKDLIDCIGNLCLVSKSANSRMNNESPKGKADKNGKYYRDNLPPKQKIMYDITNKNNKWEKDEIIGHYKDVINILNNIESLFKQYV